MRILLHVLQDAESRREVEIVRALNPASTKPRRSVHGDMLNDGLRLEPRILTSFKISEQRMEQGEEEHQK